MQISLREITGATVRKIVDLTVADVQQRFVAPNAVSLAEALFAPEAWYRAIYADEEPVGFVMLFDDTLRPNPPDSPTIFVWRFMIDARFQGRGIGRAALEQVIDHVRQRNVVPSLLLSYVPGAGSPEGFYHRLGFRPNGKVAEGEIVLELPLEQEVSQESQLT